MSNHNTSQENPQSETPEKKQMKWDGAKNDSVYEKWERDNIVPGWNDHLKSALDSDNDADFSNCSDRVGEIRNLKEKMLLPDGNLDVVAILRKYLNENGSVGWLSNEDLLKELQRYEDPFLPDWGTRNPARFIFSSYLWNFAIKTQFSSQKSPTLKMRNLRNSFIDEMIPYVTSGLDLALLRRYSKRIKMYGFQYAPTDNYYEIPAILRILTPPYEYFVPSVYCDRRHYYMRRCLEGLPHGVLMYPFDNFKLYDIGCFRNAKLVSRIVGHLAFSLKFLIYFHFCL